MRTTIKRADSIFISNNFALLASTMNIDANKALIIQAKLYPNPILTADFNAFNPTNNQTFDIGSNGQKSFQLEQLILLGGKRKKSLDLAKTNVVIAELEFQDLIRNLKFELHSGLYALFQQRSLLNVYNEQMVLLDKIIIAFDEQSKKGNIPLKDVVRIKGVYLNLNNTRAELLKMHFSELSRVQCILQTDKVVLPTITESDFESRIKSGTIDELKTIALKNRADYLIYQQNITAAQQYLAFQKSLAVPDVNLFGSYDQRGGAFVNQVNVGFSVPLPVWNRNQGNINASRYIIKQEEYNEAGLKLKIFAELQNNFLIYTQTVSEYKKAAQLYNDDFEKTLAGMTDNFQKRNISLIEFVDFFEAYNNALAEVARIKIQLAVSAEQLNLTSGKEVY